MSIKKSIMKAIKDKADSLEKQECTLSDKELFSAVDDIESTLHKRKDITENNLKQNHELKHKIIMTDILLVISILMLFCVVFRNIMHTENSTTPRDISVSELDKMRNKI